MTDSDNFKARFRGWLLTDPRFRAYQDGLISKRVLIEGISDLALEFVKFYPKLNERVATAKR